MTEDKGGAVAPGFAFAVLLAGAKPASIRELLGHSIVEVLQQLDPTLLEGDSVGRIAARVLDPLETLGNPDTCAQVVDLLPLLKARELAEKVGVEGGRLVYQNLREAVCNQSNLPKIHSFFGVVTEERAPQHRSQDLLHLKPNYPLFDHQRQAADRVLRMLSEEPRKVVLHMPTGSGKTRTAMHIVAAHLRSYRSTVVVWLAHSEELLEQAASEFEESWAHLGNRDISLLRFWGNRRPDVLSITDGVLVAGLGKMHSLDKRDPNRILRLADRASLTVLDEAHQALAPTYSSILAALHTKRPANSMLGLTATPGRTWLDVEEDEKLSGMFDRRKVTIGVEGYPDPVTFLIEQGYLARPTFRWLASEAELAMGRREIAAISRSTDVPPSILKRLGKDSKRNLQILAEVEGLAKRHSRVIVFAPSVESARILATLLGVRDLEAEVVTAETDSLQRDRLLRRFKSEDTRCKILCNYGVLTTGFDAPRTSAAVIARPTRSLVLYSQMVGRATRGPRVGGNSEAEIVTVIDPHLPGFGSLADAFRNWEDVWNDAAKK